MRGARGFAARRRMVTQRGPGVSARQLLSCVLVATVACACLGWVYYLYSVTADLHESVRAGRAEASKRAPLSVATALEERLQAAGGPGGLRAQEKGPDNADSSSAGDPVLVLYKDDACGGEVLAEIRPKAPGSSELHGVCQYAAGSMRLQGGPEIDFYASCQRDGYYVGSLFASEGCVKRYNYPSAKSFRFLWQSSLLSRKQIPEETLETQWAMQDHRPRKPAGQPPKARIVFSCESSEYFGYQVWANYYAFLTSGQSSAAWTRLLTGGSRDDLADSGQVKGLATFQAKRSLYSRRYSPINKPDVISKWFESPDAPQEEIIVVIDPDNWLLRDLDAYVSRVTPGNAVGEPAYYHGSRTAQRLWKKVCLQNCDIDVDLVGVPYIVHRDDLAAIAPLWRSYTIMLKDMVASDPAFKKEFGHLDLAWASEMFGYNFASAHVGVRHEVVPRIQVRDVDSEHRKEKLKDVAMIHVGRAWFPQSYEPAQQWAHTEGKSFSRYGQQVWCKCNNTASTIMPWPVPPEAGFQSTKTLEILHYAHERFGPIPINTVYRKGTSRGAYGASLD